MHEANRLQTTAHYFENKRGFNLPYYSTKNVGLRNVAQVSIPTRTGEVLKNLAQTSHISEFRHYISVTRNLHGRATRTFVLRNPTKFSSFSRLGPEQGICFPWGQAGRRTTKACTCRTKPAHIGPSHSSCPAAAEASPKWPIITSDSLCTGS